MLHGLKIDSRGQCFDHTTFSSLKMMLGCLATCLLCTKFPSFGLQCAIFLFECSPSVRLFKWTYSALDFAHALRRPFLQSHAAPLPYPSTNNFVFFFLDFANLISPTEILVRCELRFIWKRFITVFIYSLV